MSRSLRSGRPRAARVAVFASVAVLMSALAFAFGGTAHADTTGNPDPNTKASFAPAAPGLNPGSTLVGALEGSLVKIHVDGVAGKLFGAVAQLCKPNLNIVTASQLSPGSFGNCIPAPFVSGSDDDLTNALSDAGRQNVDFGFRIGTGTQTFQADNGPSTITCDAAHACALWIQESVATDVNSSGSIYKHYNVTYAGVPGAPALSVVPGNGQLTVNLTAPANTGNSAAPLTYAVTVAGPNGSTQSGTGTSFVFGGLTNFSAYSVSVTATSTAANGTTHFTSAPATGGGTPVAPPPGTPTGVSGDGSVDLTWAAPAGPAPDSYNVVATPVSPAGADVVRTSSGPSLSFTGLTNGTTYTFKVQGVYGGNTGPFSAPSAQFTPKVPTFLSATPALAKLSALKLYLLNLNATLTSASGPIAGAPIAFTAGSTVVCTATTDAAGTATCSGTGSALQIILALGYHASFAGSATQAPAAAAGALVAL